MIKGGTKLAGYAVHGLATCAKDALGNGFFEFCKLASAGGIASALTATGAVLSTTAIGTLGLIGLIGLPVVSFWLSKRDENERESRLHRLIDGSASTPELVAQLHREFRTFAIEHHLDVQHAIPEAVARKVAATLPGSFGEVSDEVIEEIGSTLRAAGLTDDSVRDLRLLLDDTWKIGIELQTQLREGFNDVLREIRGVHDTQASSHFSNLSSTHVPVPTRGFVGRTHELEALQAWLVQGDQKAIALWGDGGLGKSELAITIASAAASVFDIVLWLPGDFGAIQPFADAISQMGLELPSDLNFDTVLGLIRKKLSARRSLVILDGAESTHIIERLLPSNSNSRLLITRRGSILPASLGIEAFEVTPMDRADALMLLKGRRRDRYNDKDAAVLSQICDALGSCALALVQAAAYFDVFASATPTDVLEMLRSPDVDELRRALVEVDPDLVDSKTIRSVAATMSLHFRGIKDGPAMAVLLCVSYLFRDGIPIRVIKEGTGLSSDVLQLALAKLETRGIVHCSRGRMREDGVFVRLHVLTQKTALAYDRSNGSPNQDRDKVDKLKSRIVSALLQFMSNEMSEEVIDQPDRWPAIRELFHHAVQLTIHLRSTNHVAVAALANQVGYFAHRNLSKLDLALDLYELAEQIDRSNRGDEHPVVATRLLNIGGVYETRGDYAKALDYYRASQRVRRNYHGHRHPVVAICLNNAGAALIGLGRDDEALQVLLEAEAMDRECGQATSPNFALRLNNVGSALERAGRLNEALERFREAEAISRKLLGEHHPQRAVHINNIGGIYDRQGKLQEALACYQLTMEIEKGVFGPDHLNIALGLKNTAGILLKLRKFEAAVEAAGESLRIFEKVFGDRDVHIAGSLRQLGEAYLQLEDVERALASLKKAEAIDREIFGDQHEIVAMDLNYIACAYGADGDVDGARDSLLAAFDVFIDLGRHDDPDVAVVGQNLIDVGVDPIERARGLGGDEVAKSVQSALEKYPQSIRLPLRGG